MITIGVVTFKEPTAVTARLAEGGALAAGSGVRATAGAPVAVVLSTGTRLGLDGGGRLDLQELGLRQRFALRAGRLRATVAPLWAGQRFLVDTPDSQIEVRGTVFEVAVVPARAECDGAATELRVFEGLVTVRRNGESWQVGPGQHWPTDCAAVAAPPPSPPAPASAASTRPASTPPSPTDRRASTPPQRHAAPAPMPTSTLAEQNDLFSAAVQARRRGDLSEAKRRLDALLARFPSGPLAESAREERDRLLPEPPNPSSDGP